MAENGEKMSKSKGNVINPDEIVAKYGADTLRMYEMFIGPFDQAAMWSTNSLIGITRFLARAYDLSEKVGNAKMNEKDTVAMHQAIKDVSERIEEMKFNTAVSALMILLNHMGTLETIPSEMFETFLKLLSPFAPHIANELWEQIGKKSTLDFEPWPQFDEKALVASNVNIVISVNGKKRAEAEIPVDLPNAEVEKFVLSLDGIKKYFNGKEPKKIIVVPNKLVNIVV